MMELHCALMREAAPPMLSQPHVRVTGTKGGDLGLVFEADCEIQVF